MENNHRANPKKFLEPKNVFKIKNFTKGPHFVNVRKFIIFLEEDLEKHYL